MQADQIGLMRRYVETSAGAFVYQAISRGPSSTRVEQTDEAIAPTVEADEDQEDEEATATS